MESTDDNTVWMSPRQVADKGELSLKVVRRLIHDGKLPAIRVGHRYRIRRSDFEQMMREGTA